MARRRFALWGKIVIVLIGAVLVYALTHTYSWERPPKIAYDTLVARCSSETAAGLRPTQVRALHLLPMDMSPEALTQAPRIVPFARVMLASGEWCLLWSNLAGIQFVEAVQAKGR
jgi:hypothetical protein